MEKKYQVFVSSTYQDLIEERNEVMKGLLELDCIPTGMELFPSTDDDQMTYIKKVIDNCDYYILILAGRYGTLHASGKSYTQLEYEYALQKEIPIIAFLHSNPSNIISSKAESLQKSRKKLADFRSTAEKKLCRYWNTPNELGALVSRSLVKLIKEKPRSGWVKAGIKPSHLEGDKFEKIFTEVLAIKEFLQIPSVSPEAQKMQLIREDWNKDSEKVELEIVSLAHSTTEKHVYALVLEEANERKKLPIVVGGYEAQAIAVALENMKPNRPLTHDLIVSVIESTNLLAKEVIIDFFEDGIFYSKIILLVAGVIIEIDSRTSDAIALAVRLKIPIYSLVKTFEKAVIEFDREKGKFNNAFAV